MFHVQCDGQLCYRRREADTHYTKTWLIERERKPNRTRIACFSSAHLLRQLPEWETQLGWKMEPGPNRSSTTAADGIIGRKCRQTDGHDVLLLNDAREEREKAPSWLPSAVSWHDQSAEQRIETIVHYSYKTSWRRPSDKRRPTECDGATREKWGLRDASFHITTPFSLIINDDDDGGGKKPPAQNDTNDSSSLSNRIYNSRRRPAVSSGLTRAAPARTFIKWATWTDSCRFINWLWPTLFNLLPPFHPSLQTHSFPQIASGPPPVISPAILLCVMSPHGFRVKTIKCYAS